MSEYVIVISGYDVIMCEYSFIKAGYGAMVLKWQDLAVHCHDMIKISGYYNDTFLIRRLHHHMTMPYCDIIMSFS